MDFEQTLAEVKRVLAENVRSLMDAHPDKDTQAKLARKAGIGQASVSRILNRQAGVTLETLHAVARAFDVVACELLEERVAPSTPPALATEAERELTARLQKVAREFFRLGGSVGQRKPGPAKGPNPHPEVPAAGPAPRRSHPKHRKH